MITNSLNWIAACQANFQAVLTRVTWSLSLLQGGLSERWRLLRYRRQKRLQAARCVGKSLRFWKSFKDRQIWRLAWSKESFDHPFCDLMASLQQSFEIESHWVNQRMRQAISSIRDRDNHNAHRWSSPDGISNRLGASEICNMGLL